MSIFNNFQFSRKEWLLILAVALGYFVDAYDIIIFSTTFKSSLGEIMKGRESEIASASLEIISSQLYGILIGGFIWGFIGDVYGRKKALLLSILTYTLFTFMNIGVWNEFQFKIVRFFAGIGLAGELGVGMALLHEVMKNSSLYQSSDRVTVAKKFTSASSLVIMIGMLGAISGGLAGTFMTNWKIAYLIGGLSGCLLIFFRKKIEESFLFESIKDNVNIKRGQIYKIFFSRKLLVIYLACIICGSGLFYCVAVFAQSAEKFAVAFGTQPLPTAALAITFYYLGAAPAELVSGYLSRLLKSRKKPLSIFLFIQIIAVYVFASTPTPTDTIYYLKCVFLGFSLGYWTLLITSATEQFGINLRASAASSIPNVARASALPFINMFKSQTAANQPMILAIGLKIGLIVSITALICSFFLKETFEKEADFID